MIKLSELTTDEFLNKTCELAPHIEELVTDSKVMSVLTDKITDASNLTEDKLKEEVVSKSIGKVFKLIPLLLKEHREAIYNILAIMSDRKVSDIAKQKVSVTINEVKSLVTDEDLMQLFLS